MRKRETPVRSQEEPLREQPQREPKTVSISGELGTAQEQAGQQSVHGPGTADPMTEGYGELVAAGYQILSREPLTIYIPPEPPANDGPREEQLTATTTAGGELVITEEYCRQALIDYPEVHPGWLYFFTRASELADELRRQDAEAAGGQEYGPSAR